MNTKNSWNPIPKPGRLVETRLVKALLDGTFPINSKLPPERELAELLGVTRPTLREALQRLARDGFIDIQHGKPTRVRDFWLEGNLGVTLALAQYQDPLPRNFIADLFSVRVLLAPTYVSPAILRAPAAIAAFLETSPDLPDDPGSFASYDWELHWQLTVQAGNTFFIHFMNSVKGLYECIGVPYFSHQHTRDHSRAFYQQLQSCARDQDAARAGELAQRIMQESASLWERISSENHTLG